MKYKMLVSVTLIEEHDDGAFYNVGTATEVEILDPGHGDALPDWTKVIADDYGTELLNELISYAYHAPEGLGYGGAEEE